MSLKAHYRCLNCAHEWHQEPTMVTCGSCGHLYIKWVNFETEFQKGIKLR